MDESTAMVRWPGRPADAPEDAPEVLLAHEIRLVPPDSYAVRYEIAGDGDHPERMLGAALGACWRGAGRPAVRYAECDYRPVIYGARVIDALIERGVPWGDIVRAGSIAHRLILASLPPAVGAPEVNDLAGFTPAAAASTT